MNTIEHIFFDLDRTLWDFDTNSKKVLEILYRDYNLQEYFPNFILFYQKYIEVNERMWQQYYKKVITKEDVRLLRFYNTIGSDKKMCSEISSDYIEISPLQTGVFEDTHEVLKELCSRGYKLHIITNGFSEVQAIKLKNSKLDSFFETVTTSDDTGYHKPDKRTFEYAMKIANASAAKSAMIGDDVITDIQGGKNAGLYTIYFNPNSHNIDHIADIEIIKLKSLLKVF